MNCSRKDTFFLQFPCYHFAAARFMLRRKRHARRDNRTQNHHTPGWRRPYRAPYPGLPSPADLRPALHHSATSWRNPQRYPHNFAVGAPSLTNKPHKTRAQPLGRALNYSLFTDYCPLLNRVCNGQKAPSSCRNCVP